MFGDTSGKLISIFSSVYNDLAIGTRCWKIKDAWAKKTEKYFADLGSLM